MNKRPTATPGQTEIELPGNINPVLAMLGFLPMMTIILIAHPDKTHAKEGRRVRLGDLKGSSAIEQDAHVGVVVQRGTMKKRKWPSSMVYVDKARSEFAVPGSARRLAFDPESCRYYDTPSELPEMANPNAA